MLKLIFISFHSIPLRCSYTAFRRVGSRSKIVIQRQSYRHKNVIYSHQSKPLGLFLRMPRRLATFPSSFLRTLLAGLEASTRSLATLGRDIAL